MTTNVNNQGIAHLAFRIGGQPLCKNRNAFVTVTPDNHMGYRICKRCEAKVTKSEARRQWWSTSSGKIELQIAFKDAAPCNTPGPADETVRALSRVPYIAEQLS